MTNEKEDEGKLVIVWVISKLHPPPLVTQRKQSSMALNKNNWFQKRPQRLLKDEMILMCHDQLYSPICQKFYDSITWPTHLNPINHNQQGHWRHLPTTWSVMCLTCVALLLAQAHCKEDVDLLWAPLWWASLTAPGLPNPTPQKVILANQTVTFKIF